MANSSTAEGISAHPDVSTGCWEGEGLVATRTGQTKPRWVAACFGPAMDASKGPFHAEFEPTNLPGSGEIMFGVVSASADPGSVSAKGLYATGSGWMFHGWRGCHYHGDAHPNDVNGLGTDPISWPGHRPLPPNCSATLILELVRGELRVYMRHKDASSDLGQIERLGTMCSGLSRPVRWATELLYAGNSVRVHLHNAPEGLVDCSQKDLWLASAARDGMTLRWAPQTVAIDPDVVLAAVTQNGMALRWAAESLRRDKKIALAAVAQDGACLTAGVIPEEWRQERLLQRIGSIGHDERALPHALLRLKLFHHLEFLPTMLDHGITIEMLPGMTVQRLQALSRGKPPELSESHHTTNVPRRLTTYDTTELARTEEAKPPEIDAWLARIGLSKYCAEIREYGYDHMNAVSRATESDIVEMSEEIKMKKPHRRVLLEEWKELIADGGRHGQREQRQEQEEEEPEPEPELEPQESHGRLFSPSPELGAEQHVYHLVFSNKTAWDGLCLEVRRHLVSQGVRVWQQKTNIPKDSDNWFAEWYPSATKARKIVCFISADYLKSPYCMKEWRVAESKGKLLVVACEPIANIMTVDPSAYPHASNALAYLDGGGQVIFHGTDDVVAEISKFLC